MGGYHLHFLLVLIELYASLGHIQNIAANTKNSDCIPKNKCWPWAHPGQHHLLLHIARRHVHPQNLQGGKKMFRTRTSINLSTFAGSWRPVELRSAWRTWKWIHAEQDDICFSKLHCMRLKMCISPDKLSTLPAAESPHRKAHKRDDWERGT